MDYYTGGDKPYLISGADDRTCKIWDYQVRGVATVCTIQSLLFPVPLLDHWFASLVTSSHVPCVLPAQGYFMREGGYFIVLFESNI